MRNFNDFSNLVRKRMYQRVMIIKALFCKRPILLNYQMGKVGSSTLGEFCRQKGLAEWHIHRFFDTPIHAFNKKNFFLKVFDLMLFRVLRILSSEVLIISGVRMPIERDISMYFHNLKISASTLESDMPSLLSHFESSFPVGDCVTWFDKELNRLVGIDIYSYPFDTSSGFSIYKIGKVRLFLYDISALSSIQAEIGRFLGVEDYRLIAKNQSSKKHYHSVYKIFLDSYQPDPIFVKNLLSTRYVKHFFSNSVHNSIKEKWIGK